MNVLQHAEPKFYPFCHIDVPAALSRADYAELERRFPTPQQIHDGPVKQNHRKDLNAREFLAAPFDPWLKEFVEYHTSEAFWNEIVRVFGAYILNTYPAVGRAFGDLRGLRVAPRFTDPKAQIHLECQFGMEWPVTKLSTVRGPHIDAQGELFAALLYVPEPGDDAGGDFLIYRTKTTRPQFAKDATITDDQIELVSRVPYEANRLAGFVNGHTAVHAVDKRKPTGKYRRHVNFTAEIDFPPFKLGKNPGPYA